MSYYLAPMETQKKAVWISTTNEIPGHKVVRYVGIAFGATVRSRGIGGDFCAGCQSTCGGEVTAYTVMAIDARNQALQRMIQNAASMGANAVIGVKIDSDQIGQGANNATIAYGTAVIIE